MKDRGKLVKVTADYFIRLVITFTTILVLLYFASLYRQFVLIYLAWLFLLAVIVVGVYNFLEYLKSRK